MPSDAIPKSTTITRKGGRRFVNIAIETSAIISRFTGYSGSVGIDVGIESLATMSDGTMYLNAAPAKLRLLQLRVAQRALSRCRRGSARRKKVNARLAAVLLGASRGETLTFSLPLYRFNIVI